MTLLDVGCGPGTLSVDLARVVAPGRVLAVDVVDDALPEARAHAAVGRCRHHRVRVDDGYALDAASLMFDVVHAHQVLQHVSDPVRLLRELRRVARASSFARQAVDRGLATADELAQLAAAWQRWGASDRGWLAIVHGEIICRG